MAELVTGKNRIENVSYKRQCRSLIRRMEDGVKDWKKTRRKLLIAISCRMQAPDTAVHLLRQRQLDSAIHSSVWLMAYNRGFDLIIHKNFERQATSARLPII